MADLSEARARAQDIPVAQVQAPGVVGTATASAIEAFGQLAGDARKGVLSANLRDELRDESLIVNALNAPETVVTAEGVDISTADPDGVIDQSSEKFRRLALARQQGKIDENTLAIEAEKTLRESIARAPGFSREFRQIAADLVGFDVTGAATRTLFGTGRTSRGGITALERARQEAEAMSVLSGMSMADSLAAVGNQMVAEVKGSIRDQRVADNRISAGEAAIQYSTTLEGDMLGVLAEFAQEIEDQGGIVDLDDYNFKLRAQHRITQNRARLALTKQDIISSENQQIVTSAIDTVLESYIAIGANKDLLTSLSRNRAILTEAITVRGILSAPTLVEIEKIAGQAGVQLYFDALSLSKGDPKIIEDLSARNPAMKLIFDIVADGEPAKLGIMLQSILTRSGRRVAEGDEELFNALAGFVAVNAAAAGEDKIYSDAIAAQLDSGMVKQPLSIVGATKNGCSTLSRTEQRNILNTYNTDLIQTESRIAQEFARGPFSLRWLPADQRFTFVGPNGESADELAFRGIRGQGGRGRGTTQFVFGDTPSASGIDFLNGYLLNVAKDRNFQADAPIMSLDLWAQQQVDLVNEQVEQIVNPVADLTRALDGERTGVERLEDGAFQDAAGNIFTVSGGVVSQIGGEVERANTVTEVETPQLTQPELAVDASAENIELVRSIAVELGIQPEIALALAQQESSFIVDNVSPKGAQGLFQLMPSVQEQFGVLDPFDPEQNIRAGLELLGQNIRRFGSLELGLAAFNWGPTNVARALRDDKNPLEVAPKETKDFVKNILSNVGLN